mmetsp:Transcript_26906/g.48389  ORF Transcript_26906/g.48389 Transcript_26906/m.48389 type:complete len:202 (-) Transcript_26906:576-1181(-)
MAMILWAVATHGPLRPVHCIVKSRRRGVSSGARASTLRSDRSAGAKKGRALMSSRSCLSARSRSGAGHWFRVAMEWRIPPTDWLCRTEAKRVSSMYPSSAVRWRRLACGSTCVGQAARASIRNPLRFLSRRWSSALLSALVRNRLPSLRTFSRNLTRSSLSPSCASSAICWRASASRVWQWRCRLRTSRRPASTYPSRNPL